MIVSYLLSSGSLAAASLAQLVTFAILARALGPAEFGLFVQISAVTAIAVQICGLGASDCLLRRVAREPASYPDLLGHNILLIGLTGAVLVIGGVAAMASWTRMVSGPSIAVSAIALLFTTALLRTVQVQVPRSVEMGRWPRTRWRGPGGPPAPQVWPFGGRQWAAASAQSPIDRSGTGRPCSGLLKTRERQR
jgi:O-antigen/teichoic acid export membrane protein